MHWTVEPNETFPKWPYNVLSVGAATSLVRHVSAEQGTQQPDETWLHSVEFLDKK